MAETQLLKDLVAARALIADPARWTQGEFARSNTGAGCLVSARNRVSLCALGAADAATRDEPTSTRLNNVVDQLRRHTGGMSLSTFNDRHTHAEVLAVFDAAIAELRTKHSEPVAPAEAGS